MSNYIPFLKLKANEIMALKELALDLQNEVIPFFDMPKKQNFVSEEEFIDTVEKMQRKAQNHLVNIQAFYLDNFDIDTNLTVNEDSNYKYLLEQFSTMPIIPVVGIDRDIRHVQAIISAKQGNTITSNKLAIRVTSEDFASFNLIEDDIDDLLGNVIVLFEQIDLIFDCRYCVEFNISNNANNIINFINRFITKFPTDKIIISGTSIPVPISGVVAAKKEKTVERKELEIYQLVKLNYEEIYLGDYTIVGADYSDTDIPGNMMQNVMTPKTVYSYNNSHYIQRGGALKTHARGKQQFNDQALKIVSEPFFRGRDYSLGDQFIAEKSQNIGNNVMPGTILKPTINAHITYMMRDYIY